MLVCNTAALRLPVSQSLLDTRAGKDAGAFSAVRPMLKWLAVRLCPAMTTLA
jgi:hypothetical protein